MKIVRRMARGRGHLIEGRQWAAQIKRIVATANEESDSMHDERLPQTQERPILPGTLELRHSATGSFATTLISKSKP